MLAIRTVIKRIEAWGSISGRYGTLIMWDRQSNPVVDQVICHIVSLLTFSGDVVVFQFPGCFYY